MDIGWKVGALALLMTGSIASADETMWDDSRWLFRSDVEMPVPVTLYEQFNKELAVVQYAVSFTTACDAEKIKGWHEVTCEVEDVSLSATPWRTLGDRPGEVPGAVALEVLTFTRNRLADKRFTFRVTKTGEIDRLRILDISGEQRRANILDENLRQMIRLALKGVQMKKVPRGLEEGWTWEEQSPGLFTLPAFMLDETTTSAQVGTETTSATAAVGATPDLAGSDVTRPTLTIAPTSSVTLQSFAAASRGFSTMNHEYVVEEGHPIIRSSGTGLLDIGQDAPVTFKGDGWGIGVWGGNGFTERRWKIKLDPTSGSILSQGVAGYAFVHEGEAVRLKEGQQVPLGEVEVTPPAVPDRGQL